ncbi:MAG TPA: cytochrome c [Acidiferrobacterales bacterium]|jgi:mono/diheme cytochrome c family protein
MRSALTTLLWLVTAGFCLPVSAAEQDRQGPEEVFKDVRGYIVYKTHCVLCHGIHADGGGRAARNYNPPPANLRLSTKSDQYKELIIRNGGAAVGRSPYMPPWGQELTDEQVRDVVYYLRVIKVGNKTAAQK